MKRILSLVLATAISLSFMPAASLQASTTLTKEIQELSHIGLITKEDPTFKPGALHKKTKKKDFKNLLNKLSLPASSELDSILKNLDSNASLTEKECYSIFLTILGYKEGTDFTNKTIYSFAESIGLTP